TLWICPTAGRTDLIRLLGSPRVLIVLVDRRIRLDYGVDDSPGLLDGILAGKQRGIAVHRVAEQPFVGIHLIWDRMTARFHLDTLPGILVIRRDRHHANGQDNLRANLKTEIIRLQVKSLEHRWWFLQADDDLCARHRQVLSGTDVERNTLPAPA